MSFETMLNDIRDYTIKYMYLHENAMRRSYLFTKQSWSILSKKVTDVFSIGSPYNGQKGTPNLIHPPDINIPPLKIPPLTIQPLEIPPLKIDFDIVKTFNKMPFNVGTNYLNKQYDLNKEEQNGLPKQ